MLKFNTQGLLIPSDIVPCTLADFRERFVIESPDDIRKDLYRRFVSYNKGLREICGGVQLRQWIDGSFVTAKPKPLDIDVVTFIDLGIAESKEAMLKDFIYPLSLMNYGVDGYIVIVYPDNHPLHFVYKADRAYWLHQFGKTKPTRKNKRLPKGFLEIIS